MQLMVLGMHRSGTSMQTRLLNLAGAYFGPEGSNTGANDENPKGFWERVEARRLNDAVLFSTGCDWNRVSGFVPGSVPDEALRDFDTGARRLILNMDGHRPWVLKEPRLCLLLPLWRKHLEVPVALHVFRHPVEVASSLQRRSQIPLDVGLVLWKFYIASAIAAARDLPAVISFHADLVADPYRSLERLVAELDHAGLKRLHVPSKQEVEAFVSQDLYRQRLADMEVESRAAAPYEEIFQLLRDEGIPDEDIVVTEAEMHRLQRYEAGLPPLETGGAGPAAAKPAALLQAEKSVAELKAALRTRQNRLEATQTVVEQLSRSSDVIARELDGGRTKLEFAREEMQAALRREAVAQEEVAKLREAWTEIEEKLQATSSREADLRSQASGFVEQIRTLEEELARRDDQLEAATSECGVCDSQRQENSRLQTEYTFASIRLERLEEAISGERAELEQRTNELARATRLLMRREDTIREQAEELNELDTAYQNFRRKYALQAKDLKALGEEHRALVRRHQVEVDELVAELAALRGSASWKLAAPVRWLARRIRGRRGYVFRRELELVARSGLFDATWYRSTYADVASSGMDPAEHYLLHGADEGRDPGPSFSTHRYLERYSDVAATGMNPLLHFLRHGRTEGRLAK